MKNIQFLKQIKVSLTRVMSGIISICTVFLLNTTSSFGQCALSVSTDQTHFNNSSNGNTLTSLWLNVHLKLSGELTNNGDIVYFTGGTFTLTNITSTPTVSNATIPSGKIIADNTITAPVTTYDGTIWLTRVPLSYNNADVFISGGIYNSSTGFNDGSGQKSSTVNGYLYSNRTVAQKWFYGMASYAPQFSYTAISGSNQVTPISGTYGAGTPTTQISNLQSGGSGGSGGNNYSGDYSSLNNFTACACAAPTVAAITGTFNVCTNSTSQLSNTTTGGVWSSANTSVATVNSNGLVTSVNSGTTIITYKVTNSCGMSTSVTATATVNTVRSLGVINGSSTVCAGSTIYLSDTSAEGTWSSSNTAFATVSTIGVVTGVAAGTLNISYSKTSTCGTVTVSKSITVNGTPTLGVINGSNIVCTGTTITLSDTTTGGTWSSSNTAFATVSTTGVVSAVAAGTLNISYSKTNSCGTSTVSKSITVTATPTLAAISGASSLCTNSTITLTDATTGGAWSSNNTAVATVNSGGVVSGVSMGAATISYSITQACGTTTVTKGLSINSTVTVPDINGSSTVNAGFTTTLTDSVANGTWSSSNTAVATVSTIGMVTGVAAGTANISYAVTNLCGATTKTKSMTVSNRAPVSNNDTVSTQNNTPVNIRVLVNDVAGSSAFVNSTLTFVSGTVPSTTTVGTFVANNDGSVTFTPVNGYHSVATVQYRISDGLSQSSSAYIVVNVAAAIIVDTDHDGAPDAIDEYPTDQYRAFNNYYPAAGYSSLLFEDNWPYKGDYDFNDLAVDYRFNTVTNASNNVVEIKYTFITRCAGAGLHSGFAFQIDNVAPNKITSVTGAKTHNAAWVSNAANGTESGQTYTNIIVFDNAYNILTYPGSGHFLNTDMTAPKVPYDTTSILMTFINNGVNPSGGSIALNSVPAAAFNPYIILGDSGSFNQNRTKEVHLPDHVPSAKMSNTYWGKGNDNSNPSAGRYYRTSNNLPWVLNISTSIPYMQEYLDISSGYLNFLNWATSNGSSNANWYLNLSGNRDNTKIYTK